MEEDTKSFWKKTPDELSVTESLVQVALVPIAVMGGFVIFGTVAGKIHNRIEARKARKLEESAIVKPDEVL